MTKIISIQRHLVETQNLHPSATGVLTGLLWDLSIAFKVIAREVNNAGLRDIFGQVGDTNATGDDVQALDIFAQEAIQRVMERGGHLCCMASEEEEELIAIPEGHPCGKYVLSFDPLDGSSNIDVNVSVGTIFSIHERVSEPEDGQGTLADALQPGRKLAAAGYVVYGSSTMMVYSTGNGVHGFTLDQSLGEFLLSHPDIRVPERGNIYSVNEGYTYQFDEGTQKYLEHVKRRGYKSRYIGSMIADVHRTLLYGGIFLYPRTYRKDPERGECKLRVLYEAAPMAALVTQAGGVATTGHEDILDIQPKSLHERCPVIMGSAADVADYMRFFEGRD